MQFFGRFSESARNALAEAQKVAASLNQPYFGTEHLLVGLLRTDDHLVPEIADNMDEESLLERLRNLSDAPRVVGNIRMEYTPRLKKLLQLAAQQAYRLGGTFVSAEHLWLGMLQDDGIAARLMHYYNVDFERAAQQLIEQLRSGGESGEEDAEAPAGEKDGEDAPRRGKASFLSRFCRDLTDAATKEQLDPVIGREPEIQRIIQILIRRTKNNPVLIGEPGVGKSAVVEGLAQRIARGAIPEMLAGKRILSLDIGSVVAGTKYRGEFEDRLKKCLDEIRKAGDIILFIDELHNIVGAGNSEGSLDAANILKPALARGDVQCIGATTLDEYRKHIETDSALERRFQPVTVGEPTLDEAEQILLGLRDRYEAHHKVRITDEAIRAAVRLSDRYIPDRFLPDKAVDLMDEAASRVRIQAYTAPPDMKQQEQALQSLLAEKKEAIGHQDFEKAASLRDEERRLREEIREKRSAWNEEQSAAANVVTEEDVAQIVSGWTGVPVTRMTQTEADRLMKLEETLHQRVVGQDEAVQAVARAIRRARAGLKDPRRPIGSFLFLGPTGVGKTELCRALGEAMFGDENAVIRIDMSEYMEKFTVSRLIGAAPGYVGYEEGGQLTEAVRRKPYSVVLLDEVEKAHPDVFNILLQILEDGRLTDNTGRVVSFKNAIIVMTSNAGAHEIENARPLGFDAPRAGDIRDYARMRDIVMKAVKQQFRPELINRLDELIVFHALTPEDIRAITALMLRQVAGLLAERGASLSWDDAAVTCLAERGYDPRFGARPLRRLISRTVEDILSEELLSGRIQLGDELLLTVENGEICVRAKERTPDKTPSDDKPSDEKPTDEKPSGDSPLEE